MNDYEAVEERYWADQINGIKTCPSATLSTTNTKRARNFVFPQSLWDGIIPSNTVMGKLFGEGAKEKRKKL
jgi:hypothetical protein